MRQELDAALCAKYPKMFVNRNKSMQETCMCWGFDHGDGWYNIIDQLCNSIQGHIDWKEKQRNYAIAYNDMMLQARARNWAPFEEYYKHYNEKAREEERVKILQLNFRDIPELIPQVTVDQIKEKFGTLRFYYTGGDTYIDGLVSMAENMSGVMCEECGNPAETRGGGWIHTTCKPCEEKRDLERAESMKQYNLEKEKLKNA